MVLQMLLTLRSSYVLLGPVEVEVCTSWNRVCVCSTVYVYIQGIPVEIQSLESDCMQHD